LLLVWLLFLLSGLQPLSDDLDVAIHHSKYLLGAGGYASVATATSLRCFADFKVEPSRLLSKALEEFIVPLVYWFSCIDVSYGQSSGG
jgi:hypothetical protein